MTNNQKYWALTLGVWTGGTLGYWAAFELARDNVWPGALVFALTGMTQWAAQKPLIRYRFYMKLRKEALRQLRAAQQENRRLTRELKALELEESERKPPM